MELRGNLKDFSLPDIIQLVGFGRKTGVLRVFCDAEGAALYFDQGHVVHAERGEVAGEEAVYDLFRLPEGEFRFHADIPAPHRTITMDPTNLVMEAARLLDESQRDAETDWAAEASGDLLGFEERPRDVLELKEDIRSLLKRRFGKSSKRLLQAVDQCGDSVEDLFELADRVEKFVRVFLDSGVAGDVAQEIRDLVSETRPPAS